MNVTVLGAGSWGTTVASLTTALNPTLIWARNPDVAGEINEQHTNATYLPATTLPRRLRATSELEEAVRAADVLIVGVPSKGFRGALDEARQWLRPWVPIVSLTKGIEGVTLLRMTEVIEDAVPGHPIAALSGPNLAREIMAGQAAASVIATEDQRVASALQQVLQHKLFRVYRNHDVIGCEIGGALKNVIAIAAGIGEGLGVGDNTRAAVITRGLAELTRLGVAMGAEPQTLSGLAGMGDLVATCMSPYSRNRTVGEMLGRGKQLDEILAEMHMVAEGVNTARLALNLAEQYGVELPICHEIHEVVTGRQGPVDAYRGLRSPGHEADPG
ncbi:MAG TPA: NAD(P)H-dependent glycerol-3-phosphate dehydrogenase [Acidimicrobiales bacterium]|jgi:glycerol-3-phosphate dehydrogenase (NAD(P)+)|nr:NAD(P)H-dependent glycerol-3-phosphate dehydrogenase [Acidimicrobiales bacterium]